MLQADVWAPFTDIRAFEQEKAEVVLLYSPLSKDTVVKKVLSGEGWRMSINRAIKEAQAAQEQQGG